MWSIDMQAVGLMKKYKVELLYSKEEDNVVMLFFDCTKTDVEHLDLFIGFILSMRETINCGVRHKNGKTFMVWVFNHD